MTTNDNSQQESANSLLNNANSTSTFNYTHNYWNQQYPYWIHPNYWQTPIQPTITTIATSLDFSDFINPETYITINGNRRKNDNGNVYLKDGDEYQFEFFNPSTHTLGIKISIDNELISKSHLVIKPGQRIHLDRFIDTNKKFLYKTYKVDANNTSVDNAIKYNGKIEVSFYKEKQNTSFLTNNNSYNTLNLQGLNLFNSSTDIIGTTANYACLDNLNVGFDNINNSFKETGKTEEGTISNQIFDVINIKFEYNPYFTFNCMLLPLSSKPIETKDLVQHCTECRTKYDKKDNFCRKCGTKK